MFFLFPVIWMLANSFKTDAAITSDMNTLAAFVPPALNGSFFDNYITILTNTNFLRYMLNTLFYAAVLIVLGIIVNGLAGYALAKINFPFKERCLMMYMRRHSWIFAVQSNTFSPWYCQCQKVLLQQSVYSLF